MFPDILPLIEYACKCNECPIRVEILILLSPVLGVQVVHSFARIVPAEQQEKETSYRMKTQKTFRGTPLCRYGIDR